MNAQVSGKTNWSLSLSLKQKLNFILDMSKSEPRQSRREMVFPGTCFKKDHIVEHGLLIGEVERLKAKESGDCSNLGAEGREAVDLNSLYQGTRK